MKMIPLFVSLLVSSGFAVAAEKVSVEKAEKLIADKVQLIDARTEEEWNEGHLKGAVRIEITADGFSEKAKAKLDPDKPVLVYCRSGGRSARAAKALEELGFDPVSDLDGGILAWEKAGKEVVEPDSDS